ncbi:hypothetical protein [Hamadaea tsunoensis]|uniref:hypothetical protein n=1 Tax=Hamadaea tsunoensis TaxID=53368 RepID=UPI0012FC7723|nr:hypothetical protein [Hamadaea tsunoensis]
MSEAAVERFEDAWRAVRQAVGAAEAEPGTRTRDRLVSALDEAVEARAAARAALIGRSGTWAGTQALHAAEARVGAFSYLLEQFAPTWTPGGGGHSAEEIATMVRPMILHPGDGGNAAEYIAEQEGHSF